MRQFVCDHCGAILHQNDHTTVRFSNAHYPGRDMYYDLCRTCVEVAKLKCGPP